MAHDRVTAGERWLAPMLRDARLATRRLFRTPVFVAATVLTLTVGLGLFGVVYTVVEKILLEPMPYRSPGDLYYVWRDYGEESSRRRAALPGSDVLELQRAGGVIENAVALQAFLGGVFAWNAEEDPIEISTIVTAPGLFEMLGVQAARIVASSCSTTSTLLSPSRSRRRAPISFRESRAWSPIVGSSST
jgi:hypothetical protein